MSFQTTFETLFGTSVKTCLKAAFLAGQNYFRIYPIGESNRQS